MESSKVRQKLSVFTLLNIVVVTLVFALGWVLYYNKVISLSYQYKGNLAMSFLFLVLYVLFVKVYDAFALSVQRKMELIISQTLSALFANFFMYVVICLLYEWFAPVWPLMLVFLAQIFAILLWVIFSKNWYYSSVPPLRTIFLYDNTGDFEHLKREISGERRLELVGVRNIDEFVDEGLCALDEADVVYICAEQGNARDSVIESCITRKLSVFIVPSINDMLISSARHSHMFHMPLLQMHISEPSMAYLFTKRAADIVLSLTALFVLWPFLLVIAIAIKLHDGGPAFYKQVRLTKNGKHFELIKFRSMRVDAESDGVARLSTGDNDDRITPIGRVIRKLRLDELPQLINILRGDMSIVGPRPERPEIAAQYERELPEFHLRLQAKAGLTGYAQVYGKYNSTPHEKLQMDMIYISNPSIVEDFKLILTTIRVLFIKESTEGVEEGQTTANRS